ncbi:MAG: hypothetical protein FJ139_09775 [Deltaproteobacteria bacterium]|nr:hypothetical protein [Deltaproteobacteria bacterium]
MKKGMIAVMCLCVLFPLGVLAGSGANVPVQEKEQLGIKLLEAVEKGDVREAEALLAKGADIESREKDEKRTPLMIAAEKANREMVVLLMRKGADVNARSKHGATPLFLSVVGRDPEIVKLLLEKGADVHAKLELPNGSYTTPMIAAHVEDLPEVIDLLSRRGVAVNDTDRLMIKMWKRHMVMSQIALLAANLKNACMAAQVYIIEKMEIVDSEEKLKAGGWIPSKNIVFVMANIFTTSGEIVLRNGRLNAENSTSVTGVPGEGKIDFQCELTVPEVLK